MSYNYHAAFQQPTGYTKQQLEEIAVAACCAYGMEFPDAKDVDVDFYFETKHVEVTGGPEPRLYSWKQLGFQL